MSSIRTYRLSAHSAIMAISYMRTFIITLLAILLAQYIIPITIRGNDDNVPVNKYDTRIQHVQPDVFVPLTHYYLRIYGNIDNPPLLLIHGFPEDGLVAWESIAPWLAKDYLVIVPDLKGYGWSGQCDGHCGFDQISIELHTAITQYIGTTRQIKVVGHDSGGMIAWGMIYRWPYIYDNAIIMACPHPKAYSEHLSLTQIYKSRYIVTMLAPFGGLYISHLDFRWMDLNVLRYANYSQKQYEHLHIMWSMSFGSMIEHYRGLVFDPPNVGFIKHANILTLYSDNDFAFDSKILNKSCEYAEHCESKIIKDVNHFFVHEKPYEVYTIIRNFFN